MFVDEAVHVMLDLETMDTAPTAVIASIGAVQFDPRRRGVLGKEFYAAVRMEDCTKVGMTCGGDTIAWWLQQSPAAQTALLVAPMKLEVVLVQFAKFIDELRALSTDGSLALWCRGPQFDACVLANAYRASAIYGPPWRYNEPRDMRTICMAASFDFRTWPRIPKCSTEHDALADAMHQALAVQECYRLLRLHVHQ